ncbi:hypothetical protein T05_7328 [Trichinella murrelli]|uniref:Uncharacterized protein n=1 Tax=Trichinella murrelli TaxID=144512 RepID=A0A0V0T4Z6_9BILA|nr:hypothetical protein T05_7328 [Trichinella murrelli]
MRISAEKLVCSDIFPDPYKPILNLRFLNMTLIGQKICNVA